MPLWKRYPNLISLRLVLAMFVFVLITSVFQSACGGGGSSAASPPAPTITSVSAACSPASVETGGTSQCTATVAGTGSYNSSVTWSASAGTISSSGAFTAPATAGTVTVTATSVQDTTKSGTATVTVTTPPPTITSVSVSCNPTSVQTGQTSQCTATVTGTGNYSSSVTWSASAGSIYANGVFTAPATAGTVTVTATSLQDTTKAGNATVTVTTTLPTITSVSVSCNPTSVQVGQTSQCTATVTGTGNYSSAVNWSVAGVQGGNSTVGTISTTGLYTVPSSVPSTNPVTVTATSVANTSESGSATVTVTAASSVITGNVMMDGQVVGSNLTFSALNADGTTGSVLASTVTDSSGNYSVTLPSGSSQFILAQSSGGSYTDQTSGQTVNLLASDTLSAALAVGTPQATLSPLTDMAAARAIVLAAGGIPLAIATAVANIGVAQQYNLPDIVGTLPVPASSVALVQTANRDQRDYGLVLAGISTEASELGVRTIDLVAGLAEDMSDGILNGMNGTSPISIPLADPGPIPLPADAGTSDLQAAVNTFVGSLNNQTNLSSFSITPTSVPVGVGLNGAGAFYVTTTVLPAWTSGQAGSATITTTGGTAPITCKVTAGSTAPAWLTVGPNCALSGTAPVLSEGTTLSMTSLSVTLTSSDVPPRTANITLTITVIAVGPVLHPTPTTCDLYNPPTEVVVSVAWAEGGQQPLYFTQGSFAYGAPPLGMIIDLNGNLVGTPAATGTYSFQVCVVDLVGAESCGQTSVTVNQPTTQPEAGTYTESCTVIVGGFTCCANGTCDTYPGSSSGSSANFTLASGTAFSQLTSEVCSTVTSAFESEGCSGFCSISSETSTSFTFGGTCTISSTGCTDSSFTLTCTATIQ